MLGALCAGFINQGDEHGMEQKRRMAPSRRELPGRCQTSLAIGFLMFHISLSGGEGMG